MANKNTDLSLIKKYEEMVGQDKKYYFDSDQIEDIALYYEEKEDYNEALNVVNFGLSLHSMNEDLSVLKVRYLLSLDFIEEAGIIIKSINSHDSVDYFLINAELLFAEGKEDKALNYINSFTLNHTLDAEDCISIINIMYGYINADKIINFIHNILEKKIELNDVLISIIAGIYIENNISEEAIKIIESYIDEQPYNLNLWFELARAYRSIEKYDEAIDSCDYALAIKNNDIDTLQFKISLLCDCNKFKEAEPLIFDLENFSDTEEQKEDADETASDFYAITENPDRKSVV